MTPFLPLGTIITLQGSDAKLMITGRLQRHSTTGQVYDYCACLWPQGYLDASSNYLFDHDQVDRLFYIGMQDEEEFNFRFRLEEAEKALHRGMQVEE